MIVEVWTTYYGGDLRGASSVVYYMLRTSVFKPDAHEGEKLLVKTTRDWNGVHMRPQIVTRK